MSSLGLVSPDPRRWWALSALVICNLVLGFDTTILNVALPAISTDLGSNSGQLQWMVNSYLVVFAAMMLPAGLLGDRFGRRRMLILGLVIFLIASLIGTFAYTAWMVIAARTFMGVGGALIMPLALSVLPSLFESEERNRALAVISMVSAIGFPTGPLIGGWLLEHFWWGAVFLINMPLVFIGIAACVFLLPESSDPASPRIDAVSSMLTVLGLGSLVFALNEGPAYGWRHPLILGMFALSVLMLATLLQHGKNQNRPMLDTALLCDRSFLWSTIAATLISWVLAGLMFVLPQYFQEVLGYDSMAIGVGLLPLMGGMAVAPKFAIVLTKRLGARVVISIGLLALSLAMFAGATVESNHNHILITVWLAVAGFGVGTAIVPAMGTALSALPSERAGSGSGLLTTMRQFGSAVGVALLGSILAQAYRARLDTTGLTGADVDAAKDSVAAARIMAERLGDGHLISSVQSAFLFGTNTVLLACSIITFVVAVLIAICLPASKPDRNAAEASCEPLQEKVEK